MELPARGVRAAAEALQDARRVAARSRSGFRPLLRNDYRKGFQASDGFHNGGSTYLFDHLRNYSTARGFHFQPEESRYSGRDIN